jgi:hypothetical protein
VLNAPQASPRRRWRKALIVVGVIILFFAGGEAYDSRQFHGSDRGFRHATGRDLPANTVAMDHASDRNDNLMHATHYWLVQGPLENLRELAPAPGFVRSDGDAAAHLAGVQLLMAVGEPKVLEGYEGSIDGGRDRWLLIFEPGDRAVFIY